MSKEIEGDRLNVVRDMFVLCCFTGLAYIDIQTLRPDEIYENEEGDFYIKSKRSKTDTGFTIPLLPTAVAIIEKYKDHPKVANKNCVIPVLSNQKSNAYLKEIADRCDIKKNLTTHLARHTFATTVTLNNGVPIETVGKMLGFVLRNLGEGGHKNLRTTQHYAQIINKKVASDMAILKEKLSGLELQNGYMERLNRFYREDVLDAFWFNDLHQLRVRTNIWMEDYNNNHPHSSLGNRSPREYRPRFGEEFFTESNNINEKLLNLDLS